MAHPLVSAGFLQPPPISPFTSHHILMQFRWYIHIFCTILTTAIIINEDVQKRQEVLKDLVKVIQQSFTHIKTQLQNVVNAYMLTLTLMCLGKSWGNVNQSLWMISWWVVLRISLKMLVSPYLRLLVTPTCVSPLTCWQTDWTGLWKKLKSGLSIWLECKTGCQDWF